MQGFVDTLNRWYDQMLGVHPAKIMSLVKMGSRVVNLLNLNRREGRADRRD